jgi:hypothetical protein
MAPVKSTSFVAVLVLTAMTTVEAVTTSAGAAPPPTVGSVACSVSGSVAFTPFLRAAPGLKRNGQSKPNTDANVRVHAAPAGCSGAQTGGNPHRPGPIAGARFIARGLATGHTCAGLSASGVHALKTKIAWRDASGAKLGVTKIAAATATVLNLDGGNPPSFRPPNDPPAGTITVTFTGTADAASKVFPGETVQATFLLDRTIDNFALPCSVQGPPLPFGVGELVFTGVRGGSTISVS